MFARAIDAALEASVVGSFTRIGHDTRRRLFGWDDLPRLDGRTVVITGANSGLGLAAARRLAGLGADVTMVARSAERGEAAREEVAAVADGGDVRLEQADMGERSQVRDLATRLAAEHDQIDVLVNNAGALLSERTETTEGIETTIAVHVVGPFLLTAAILPLLRRSEDPRVVTVSSGGMYTQRLDLDDLQSRNDYRGSIAYARAKRLQVVLNRHWAARIDDVTFCAMHPGWAATPGVSESLPGFERVIGPLLRTPEQGADTIAWSAAAPGVRGDSGRFWLDRRPRGEYRLPGTRADEAVEARAWEDTMALSGWTDPIA